jgi:hypothetical protein
MILLVDDFVAVKASGNNEVPKASTRGVQRIQNKTVKINVIP